MIALNPMDTIDAPKVRYAEKGIFTDKELQQIFDAVTEIASNKCNTRQSHDYNLLFTMLLQCGMRVGELLALQWQDVNFQKEKSTFMPQKFDASRNLTPQKLWQEIGISLSSMTICWQA